jgi:hypothetical protein
VKDVDFQPTGNPGQQELFDPVMARYRRVSHSDVSCADQFLWLPPVLKENESLLRIYLG